MEVIIKATDFAARKHADQRRKNQAMTPYINHPIGVASILSSIGGVTDTDVLAAAILHDTVEDTDTEYSELVEEFGATIANIVMEVTDDKSLSKVERKKLQVTHAESMSTKAKLVKLADKLYNLRDLQRESPKGWSHAVREGYFVWAKACVDNARGTNAAIEAELDLVFEQNKPIYVKTLEHYYSCLTGPPPTPIVCLPPMTGFGGFR